MFDWLKAKFEPAALLIIQCAQEARKVDFSCALIGLCLGVSYCMSYTYFFRQLPDFFYILSPATDYHVQYANYWSKAFPICLIFISVGPNILAKWVDQWKLNIGACFLLLLMILSKPHQIVHNVSIDDIRQGLNSTINGTYSDTQFQTNFTRDWTTVQQKYQCCGIDNLNDWTYAASTPNSDSACVTDRCCHKNLEGDADRIIKPMNRDGKCYKYGCLAHIVDGFYDFELKYSQQAKLDDFYMAVIMTLAIFKAYFPEGIYASTANQDAPDGREDKKNAPVRSPQPVDNKKKSNAKDEKKNVPVAAQPGGGIPYRQNRGGGRGGKRGKKHN